MNIKDVIGLILILILICLLYSCLNPLMEGLTNNEWDDVINRHSQGNYPGDCSSVSDNTVDSLLCRINSNSNQPCLESQFPNGGETNKCEEGGYPQVREDESCCWCPEGKHLPGQNIPSKSDNNYIYSHCKPTTCESYICDKKTDQATCEAQQEGGLRLCEWDGDTGKCKSLNVICSEIYDEYECNTGVSASIPAAITLMETDQNKILFWFDLTGVTISNGLTFKHKYGVSYPPGSSCPENQWNVLGLDQALVNEDGWSHTRPWHKNWNNRIITVCDGDRVLISYKVPGVDQLGLPESSTSPGDSARHWTLLSPYVAQAGATTWPSVSNSLCKWDENSEKCNQKNFPGINSEIDNFYIQEKDLNGNTIDVDIRCKDGFGLNEGNEIPSIDTCENNNELYRFDHTGVCVACESGKFSNSTTNNRCQPHRVCGWNQDPVGTPTNVSDRTCNTKEPFECSEPSDTTGYDIDKTHPETRMNIWDPNRFSVKVSCAEGYYGIPLPTECDTQNQHYTLSGCEPCVAQQGCSDYGNTCALGEGNNDKRTCYIPEIGYFIDDNGIVQECEDQLYDGYSICSTYENPSICVNQSFSFEPIEGEQNEFRNGICSNAAADRIMNGQREDWGNLGDGNGGATTIQDCNNLCQASFLEHGEGGGCNYFSWKNQGSTQNCYLYKNRTGAYYESGFNCYERQNNIQSYDEIYNNKKKCSSPVIGNYLDDYGIVYPCEDQSECAQYIGTGECYDTKTKCTVATPGNYVDSDGIVQECEDQENCTEYKDPPECFTLSNVTKKCASAAPGYYVEGDGSVQTCSAVTNAATDAALTCTSDSDSRITQCANGHYKQAASSSGQPDTCPPCSPVTNAAADAIISCTNVSDSQITQCAPGYEKTAASAGGADTCTSCSAGKYSDTTTGECSNATHTTKTDCTTAGETWTPKCVNCDGAGEYSSSASATSCSTCDASKGEQPNSERTGCDVVGQCTGNTDASTNVTCTGRETIREGAGTSTAECCEIVGYCTGNTSNSVTRPDGWVGTGYTSQNCGQVGYSTLKDGSETIQVVDPANWAFYCCNPVINQCTGNTNSEDDWNDAKCQTAGYSGLSASIEARSSADVPPDGSHCCQQDVNCAYTLGGTTGNWSNSGTGQEKLNRVLTITTPAQGNGTCPSAESVAFYRCKAGYKKTAGTLQTYNGVQYAESDLECTACEAGKYRDTQGIQTTCASLRTTCGAGTGTNGNAGVLQSTTATGLTQDHICGDCTSNMQSRSNQLTCSTIPTCSTNNNHFSNAKDETNMYQDSYYNNYQSHHLRHISRTTTETDAQVYHDNVGKSPYDKCYCPSARKWLQIHNNGFRCLPSNYGLTAIIDNSAPSR